MGNTLYEQDFHAWAMRQAELLRDGKLDCADIENIAEEIESRERGELTNRLSVLLMHLLKWRFQPSFRGNSWRATIETQRIRIDRHMRDNPSLKSYLDQAMRDAYREARVDARGETGLAPETFPDVCPFTFGQAIDDDFWPDN